MRGFYQEAGKMAHYLVALCSSFWLVVLLRQKSLHHGLLFHNLQHSEGVDMNIWLESINRIQDLSSI